MMRNDIAYLLAWLKIELCLLLYRAAGETPAKLLSKGLDMILEEVLGEKLYRRMRLICTVEWFEFRVSEEIADMALTR